jgi:uncharacterized membrane protein YccC
MRLRRPASLVHDPGLVSLRKGARAALGVTAALALATSLGIDPQAQSFFVFGTFAFLALADFGGPPWSRLGAYLVTLVLGALLIALGSIVSPNAWLSALVMTLVAFAVSFTAIFGGYAAASQTALLLPLVIAVTIPIEPAGLGARVLGWVAAGVLATGAALLLWPLHEHRALMHHAANACRRLAALIGGGRQAPEAYASQLDAARAEVEALRRDYTAAQHRPVAPTRDERALAELLANLDRTVTFAAEDAKVAAVGWGPPPDATPALRAALVRTLEDCARALEGQAGPPAAAALDEERAQHRAALDRWAAAELRAGTQAEAVLDGFEQAHTIRLLSYVTSLVGQDVASLRPTEADGSSVAGRAPGRPIARALAAWLPVARRAWAEARTHLNPSSVWFRNSLRVAIGLGLAVLLARLSSVGHAFWVVLGALSVLRGSAATTSRTAAQALLGTVIGFAVAAAFILLTGASTTLLWIALPICVFLAAYTPTAVHFVVGQAAFTLMVVILYNLLSPEGVGVGLVRVEDVAIGTAISLGVGVVLWPRGARGQLRSALATFYRQCAIYLASSLRKVLGQETTDEGAGLRRAAHAEAERAGEVFARFLVDRGTKSLPVEDWAELLAGGKRFMLAGEILDYLAREGYVVGQMTNEASRLGQAADDVLARLLQLAEQLETGQRLQIMSLSDGGDERRQAEIACLRHWGGADDPAVARASLALVRMGDWLRDLERLIHHLEAPAAAAGRTADVPWWS